MTGETQRQVAAGSMEVSMPSEREVQVTRVFEAPRTRVWEAWTEPRELRQWLLGPEGWTMAVCDVDLRPGGQQRFVWRGPGGEELQISGVYREVAPPERLVSTESWGGDWPETLNTLTLTEREGKTTMTLTILYPSREARDAAMATGMADGMGASFDRLEAHLKAPR